MQIRRSDTLHIQWLWSRVALLMSRVKNLNFLFRNFIVRNGLLNFSERVMIFRKGVLNFSERALKFWKGVLNFSEGVSRICRDYNYGN